MPYREIEIPNQKLYTFRRKFVGKQGVSTHRHSFFEIEYFISGEGSYIVNGKVYKIRKGMMALITPSDICTLPELNNYEDNPAEIFHAKLDISFLPNSFIPSIMNSSNRVVYFDDTEKIESLFRIAESCPDDKYRGYTVKNMLYECIIEFLRMAQVVPPDSESDFVSRAVGYINLHFAENLTVESIAKSLSVSSSYFSHTFTKTVGKTFRQYLIDVRFNYAKKLIEYSDFSITEICFASGFNSLISMDRVFKLKIGMPPLAYKKSLNRK